MITVFPEKVMEVNLHRTASVVEIRVIHLTTARVGARAFLFSATNYS